MRGFLGAAVRVLFTCSVVLLLGACGMAHGGISPRWLTPEHPSNSDVFVSPSGPPFAVAAATSSGASLACAERVLIISLDGLRPDALSSLRTPNLMQLAGQGAYSSRALTTTASTLPAHASMLSGYGTLGHGIFWNDYVPLLGFIRSSTVFSIAHEHDLQTAMLVAKEKLIHIAAPGTVDDYAYITGGDDQIMHAGIERIQYGFGVLFIHLRALDSTGHRYGWMSGEYMAAVGRSDQRVGELLGELEASGLGATTLVMITADHGGSGTSHGSRSEQDRTIPWIVSGPGVVPGMALGEGISVVDTAATALWSMGLPLPDGLDGQPVAEAFFPHVAAVCDLEPLMMSAPEITD